MVTFTKKNYKPSHLLHLGRDHFYCGLSLLRGSTPQTIKEGNEEIKVCVFDSASYLIHLGIELLLKAMLLEEKDMFTDLHNLTKIKEQISSLSNLPSHLVNVLEEIDGYFFSRYGNYHEAQTDELVKHVEIGNENSDLYSELFINILNQMPKSLKNEYRSLDPYKKAGRVLMEKIYRK